MYAYLTENITPIYRKIFYKRTYFFGIGLFDTSVHFCFYIALKPWLEI